MRKFLWVVAVGVLLLTVAAPAMAVDVKFGGEWRVRFYDYANLGFNTYRAQTLAACSFVSARALT